MTKTYYDKYFALEYPVFITDRQFCLLYQNASAKRQFITVRKGYDFKGFLDDSEIEKIGNSVKKDLSCVIKLHINGDVYFCAVSNGYSEKDGSVVIFNISNRDLLDKQELSEQTLQIYKAIARESKVITSNSQRLLRSLIHMNEYIVNLLCSENPGCKMVNFSRFLDSMFEYIPKYVSPEIKVECNAPVGGSFIVNANVQHTARLILMLLTVAINKTKSDSVCISACRCFKSYKKSVLPIVETTISFDGSRELAQAVETGDFEQLCGEFLLELKLCACYVKESHFTYEFWRKYNRINMTFGIPTIGRQIDAAITDADFGNLQELIELELS